MKITFEPDEQIVRDIRSASDDGVDFGLQLWTSTPGAQFKRLVSAKLLSWSVVGGTCKHEPKVFETEWLVYEPEADDFCRCGQRSNMHSSAYCDQLHRQQVPVFSGGAS